MKLIAIDPKVSADQELRITLDAQPAVLRLTWNSTTEFWHLAVSNAESSAALTGLKLVPPLPLFFVSPGLAPIRGDFMVLRVDASAQERIAYEDLGLRWGLFYLTSDEVSAWRRSRGLA